MNKPDCITNNDWKLLLSKYSNNLEYLDKKLKESYPIQYLIGYVDFCGFKIMCDERALIPRFETEHLVDKTVNYIKNFNIKYPKILEIGTGSGCIAISLAKLIPESEITAIDISEEAINLAKKNAKLNNVQINFKKQDIMLEKEINNYDVIISNPPYVEKNTAIDPEVNFEPSEAVFVKKEGIEFYQQIISQASKATKLLAFEIGYDQKNKIKNISQTHFPGNNFVCEQDLTGKDRYIFITNE